MQTRPDLIKIITRIERVFLAGLAFLTIVDFNAKLSGRDIIETKLYTPSGVCYKITRQKVFLDEHGNPQAKPLEELEDLDGDGKFDKAISYEYSEDEKSAIAHWEDIPTGEIADTYINENGKFKECYYNKNHPETGVCWNPNKKEVVTQ